MGYVLLFVLDVGSSLVCSSPSGLLVLRKLRVRNCSVAKEVATKSFVLSAKDYNSTLRFSNYV